MKAQLDELRAKINQQVKATIGQIEVVAKRLGGIKKNMAGKEMWDIRVKDALIQLLNNQKLFRLRRPLQMQQYTDLRHPRKCTGLLHAAVCGKPDPDGTGGHYRPGPGKESGN